MALDPMWDPILRFGHILSGITWIGMLYWFNLINVNLQKSLSPEVKKEVNFNLLAPTLFWFRWGAMFTLLFGLALYYAVVDQAGGDFGAYGRTNWVLHLGMLIAITMWFNVWFIIWPRQKQVLASLKGQGNAPDAGEMRKAYLASRYNTFASIPMLMMMVASAHWKQLFTGTMNNTYLAVFLVAIVAVMLFGHWAMFRFNPAASK